MIAQLQLSPEAASIRFGSGDLPLHLACRVTQDVRVVELLIAYYRLGLKLNDASGGSALHNACVNRSDAALAVVKLLLREFGGAALQTGSCGEYPLHVACRWSRNVAVAEAVCEASPTALIGHDDQGGTPLHAAAASEDPQMAIVVLDKLYVQLAPRALAAKNLAGQTALYVACRYSSSSENVLELLERRGPGTVREDCERACAGSIGQPGVWLCNETAWHLAVDECVVCEYVVDSGAIGEHSV